MNAQQPLTTREDRELIGSVRAAQRGNREAFGRLVVRYERAVYATAFRQLGHHAEAKELCQDVFVQALRKIRQLPRSAVFRRVAALDHQADGGSIGRCGGRRWS